MADIKSHDTSNTSDQVDEEKSRSVRDQVKEDLNDLVFSYVTLRNLIGFSGILLPTILVIFSKREEHEKVIQSSISAYYYTSVGDVFCYRCLYTLRLPPYVQRLSKAGETAPDSCSAQRFWPNHVSN